jgi:hypothetical protein
MAATGYTPISLYYSSTTTNVPLRANLVNGELALNIADGKLFYKDSGGVVQVLATKSTAAGSFTSITDSGNLTFTGTASRVLADFSNATVTSRLSFQTSTTNGTTGIYALPNGTGTAASWQATNAADPTNASKILIATNGSTDVQLVSGINGTGTYLPLSFYTNGAEKMRIDTSGNVGIGTASPSKKVEVFVAANSLQIESLVRNDQSGTGVAAIGFNVSSSAASETTSTKAGIGLVRSNSYGVGSLVFYNNATTSAGDFTTADERMRIDTNGNVLVGTTSTLSNSTLVANQGIAARTAAASGVTPYLQMYNGNAGTDLETWRIGGQAAGGLIIETVNDAYNSSTPRLQLDSAGSLNLYGSYTEAVVAIGNSSTAKTLSLASGTFQTVTMTGNCTFTMPTAVAGKSFILEVNSGAGGFTGTFTSVKWPNNAAPTLTATASRWDFLAFFSDGTNWYGNYVQAFQ